MGSSVISLGLGLGGGKAATSSGRASGGGSSARFNIDVRETEATILARTGDAVGAIAYGTDTYDLYVYDGSAWQTYENYVAPPAYSNTLGASFDGTDDIIDVGDISAINSATNLTISGWFNASSFPHAAYNSMWGGGGAGGSTHPTRFWLSCNNGSLFRIWYGTSTNFTFAYSISTGTWYNVVLTIDGSTVKLYVNGSQEGSTVTTAPSVYATAGDEFEIGANPTYRPYYWDGYIDEFAVFNSTLSASDVTAIYNSGVPADLTSLSPVHWWRMGDGTGDTDDGGGSPASGDTIGTIADQGSGSNNGTGTNGPAFSSTIPS